MASKEYNDLIAYVTHLEEKYGTVLNVHGNEERKMHRLSRKCYNDFTVEFTIYEYYMTKKAVDGEITPGQLKTIFSHDGSVRMSFVINRMKSVENNNYVIVDRKERWEK